MTEPLSDKIAAPDPSYPPAEAVQEDRAPVIDPTQPPPPRSGVGLRDGALWWTKHGFAVFPMREFGNRPHPLLGSGWSFGTVGSTDPAQIHDWWTLAPWANIGIDAGASGLLVLDHDVKRADQDGIRSMLDWLDETGCAMPDDAPTVRTPSGGLHVYLRVTEPVRFVHSWLPGVDAQSDGACVAAPPSFRRAVLPPKADEHRRDAGELVLPYELLSGDLTAIPPAPAELVDAVRRGRWWMPCGRAGQVGGRAAGAGDFPSTEWFLAHGFRAGQRNGDALRLARRLWARLADESMVIAFMRDAWAVTVQDDFAWSEVLHCVASAGRYWRDQVERDRAVLNAWTTR